MIQGVSALISAKRGSPRVRRLSSIPFLLAMCFGMATAHAASVMQKWVYDDPSVCERFKKALVKDRVVDLESPHDLCAYRFVDRRDEGYFKALDWRSVDGDPVAQTMKIFDANFVNALPHTPLQRKEWESYAKFQAAKRSLFVEIAPFVLTELVMPATFKKVNGYILRSRGEYCLNANDDSTTNGRSLIAFYTDEGLTHSIPIFTGQVLTTSYVPLMAGDKYLVYNFQYFDHRFPLPKDMDQHRLIDAEMSQFIFVSDSLDIFLGDVCDYRFQYGKLKR